jgi:hypothetical protein
MPEDADHDQGQFGNRPGKADETEYRKLRACASGKCKRLASTTKKPGRPPEPSAATGERTMRIEALHPNGYFGSSFIKFACLALLLMISGFGIVGAAQVVGGRGVISGIVTDPSGAIVRNAVIIVTDTETNVAVTAKTNGTGFYVVRQLVPDLYQVSCEQQGFKQFLRTGITVDSDTTVDVNIAMALGSVDEQVTVTGQQSLLNTESGANPQIMDTLTLLSVPTSGDNATLLLKLQPGIQATDPQNQYMGGSMHANAANSSFGTAGQYKVNEFSLDGAPNMMSNHQQNYATSSEEVKEISTDTSGFDATVGKTMGVNVNTVSKNGTDQLHGSYAVTYDDHKWQPLSHFSRIAYMNNATLSATCESPNENSPACGALKKQYGELPLHDLLQTFTLGGPVIIPKLVPRRANLFFFIGYIWNYYPDPLTGSSTLPTTREKGGDFSDLPCIVSGTPTVSPVYSLGSCPTPSTSNFGQYAIYDPTTTVPDPAHATHFIRTAFPGNVIPAGRIQNPLAPFLNKELPAPNTADLNGNFADTANYTYALTEPEWYTAISPRVDWTPGANDRFFFRSSRGRFDYDRPYCCQVDNLGVLYNGRLYFVATLGWDHIFTPNLTVSTALAYNRYAGPASYPLGAQNTAASLGLPSYIDPQTAASNMNPVLPPTISLNTYSGLGYNSNTLTGYSKTPSVRGNFTYVHAEHSVQFGGEFRMQQTVSPSNGNANGTLSFDNTYTRVSDNASYLPTGSSQLGTSYAAFLLGYQTSASQTVSSDNRSSSPYMAFYGQDSWRVSRKLTLNAGLRYEYEWGPVEAHNRQISGFDPNQPLAIAGGAQTAYAGNLASYNAALPSGFSLPASINVQGGAIYAGVNGAKAQLLPSSYRVLPRLAASYEVTPKTNIRVGYGLFFDTLNVLNNSNDTNGYNITTSIPSSNNNGQTYVANAAIPVLDPFPQTNGSRYLTPYGNTLGNLIDAGGSQTYYATDYVPARQHRWQFSLQRQLDSHSLLQVTYEGSWTAKLGTGQNVNFVPASLYTTGQVVNPNNSKLTANVTNPFNISNYSGLQTSNPAAYTYLSKSGFFTGTTTALDNLFKPYPHLSGLTQNNNLGKSRFNQIDVLYRRRFGSTLDMSADYSRNFQYDRDWFANSYDPQPSWHDDVSNSRPSRLSGTAVWKLPFGKGMHYATSGWKNAVFSGFQYGATFEAQQGQLITWGNLFFTGCTTSWQTCDTSSIKLAHPTYGQWFNTKGFSTTSATSLNSRVFPYVIDGVRTMGINNWNMNFERNISLTERAKLEVRVEAMDVFNHLLVGGPNTSPTSAQFGQVTGDLYGSQPNYGRFIQLVGRLSF